MGQQDLPTVSIDQFEQPRSKAPWIVGLVVAVLVAGLAFAAFRSNSSDPAAPPTPTPSQTSQPTPGGAKPSGNGVYFESQRENADGYWSITKQEWTNKGLQLTITVQVTRGHMAFSFFALDDETTVDYDPSAVGSNDITTGNANEGETVTGTILFEKKKGDTTVVLTDGTGRQVSALHVKG